VGGWTVQTGANTLTATVSGVATPATFTATGVASTFNIEVQYLTQLDSAHRAAFDSAAARWSRVVFGDLPAQNVMFNQGGPSGTPCARPEVPATNRSVDDVLIFAIVQPIDGPFNILGSAGPCILRGSSNLPAVGIMRFDEEDLDFLHTNNLLRPVILHEMAHVLGFGTLWNFGIFNLLSGAGQADPFFTGAQARAAFDQNGGAGYAGGGKVPVENTGGPGTRDGHWRETVFDSELMTGFIDGGTQLSVITAASFADMGYQLNFAGSDPFTVPFPAALRAASGPQVHLVDDILHGAVHVVDPAGRVLRVLQRR
jgi:hypothetical protein